MYQNDLTPLDANEVEEAKVIIAKLHPLANTPFEKVFPTIGCFFRCCGCCHTKRKERMLEMKKIMKEEREKQDKIIEEVFLKYNVKFEGQGPDAFSQGHNYTEHDNEDYDPYT